MCRTCPFLKDHRKWHFEAKETLGSLLLGGRWDCHEDRSTPCRGFAVASLEVTNALDQVRRNFLKGAVSSTVAWFPATSPAPSKRAGNYFVSVEDDEQV